MDIPGVEPQPDVGCNGPPKPPHCAAGTGCFEETDTGMSANGRTSFVLSAATLILTACSLSSSHEGRAAGLEQGSPSSTDKVEQGAKGRDMKPRYSKSGYDITPLSREAVAELASKLDPEARASAH